jgi:hypothetical protein
LGLLTHLKAWSHARSNAIHHCVETLWIDEKDAGGIQKLQTHPSCAFTPKQDEISKFDSVYLKCQQTHPQYYFNNLGLLHIKLKKYNMAIYYLSKSLKFVDK